MAFAFELQLFFFFTIIKTTIIQGEIAFVTGNLKAIIGLWKVAFLSHLHSDVTLLLASLETKVPPLPGSFGHCRDRFGLQNAAVSRGENAKMPFESTNAIWQNYLSKMMHRALAHMRR